jgi:hypothetical protein
VGRTPDAELLFEALSVPGQWRVLGGREPYLIVADAGRGIACSCRAFRWRCRCRHVRELVRRQSEERVKRPDAAPQVTLDDDAAHPQAALLAAIDRDTAALCASIDEKLARLDQDPAMQTVMQKYRAALVRVAQEKTRG